MPAVNYRTERTCCDDDRPVTMATKLKTHYRKGTGVWLRSACCGTLHYAERVGSNAS